MRRLRALALLVPALVITVAFVAPAGAVNAELTRVHSTRLTGAAEVPGPGDPDGAGAALVITRPRTNTVCVVIWARRIELPATLAHIHKGPVGVAGPVVVPLDPPDERRVSKTCAEADPALVRDIGQNPGDYYVNVHTASYPSGAIRGQLH